MLNEEILNTGLQNDFQLESFGTYSTELIVFNNYIFNNGITVTDIKEDSGSTRDLQVTNVVRSHGQYIISDYFNYKKITVKGWCKKDTQELLDNWIDEFKKSLIGQNGNLDITRRGVLRRRYKATLVNYETMFDDKEPYHVTITPFICEFLCIDPFGYDTDYTVTNEVMSSSSVNISITNTGTVETRPLIYLSLDSGSITELKVTNVSTGANMTISQAISSGIIKIDSELLETKINDASINFTGAFIVLQAGTNILKFDTVGTNFNLNTTIKWKNAFI